MKSFVFLAVLFSSIGIGAQSPSPSTYAWLTCESDEVRIRAYREECIRAVTVTELGEGTFALERTRCDQPEDLVSFEVGQKDAEGKGQYYVTAHDGVQGVVIIGHFDDLTYSDDYMDVYKANAEVHLQNESTGEVSKFENVQCDLELNLWPK